MFTFNVQYKGTVLHKPNFEDIPLHDPKKFIPQTLLTLSL